MFFFFSSRRRHTRSLCDWSSDVCSSDLPMNAVNAASEGASTIEHHYGYPESSFTTQTIQNLPPSYNYANEPDRFLETGRAWLQADGERLHGEVIQSLLATMRKTGFIMVPKIGRAHV